MKDVIEYGSRHETPSWLRAVAIATGSVALVGLGLCMKSTSTPDQHTPPFPPKTSTPLIFGAVIADNPHGVYGEPPNAWPYSRSSKLTCVYYQATVDERYEHGPDFYLIEGVDDVGEPIKRYIDQGSYVRITATTPNCQPPLLY